ncbi:hypothetical protein BURPS1106A_A0168 [Burkholderia pseudomallei 1106a]|uniref:Uncharacterized protein n=1 Tax=Burkholderia pseudomallei (strain 1106a) TaxID=357348 RepID=A3P1K1_BURP0|nr:hypothetical protein BURPS1106A_A0168 [Burkholderia pseudomallei 1106a]
MRDDRQRQSNRFSFHPQVSSTSYQPRTHSPVNPTFKAYVFT